MRILVTSIVDLEKSAPQRPHHFIKHLKKNHDVTVICPNDWWKGNQVDASRYHNGKNEYLDEVDVRYITYKRISPIMQELMSPALIKMKQSDHFDIIFNYNTLISGSYLAKKLNIPMVYDLADDLPAMIAHSPQVPKPMKSFGEKFGEFLLKRNINYAKKMTCTSRALQDTYQIPEYKFELIPNGVNTDLFCPMTSNVRDQFNLNGNFVLGYVGMLREWVDLEPVYQAMQSVNNVKLLIVGEEGNMKENQELVKKYGIKDDVIFTGTIPYPNIPQYISAMDICLIPFRKNGISENAVPLKLFEYMACGKPVISTKITGVQKIVKDLIQYVDNCDDYKKYLSNPFIASNNQKSPEKLREFVIANYQWSKLSEKIETTLEANT